MAEVVLSQIEADALILMEKHRLDSKVYALPDRGKSTIIDLISSDGRERFLLDLYRKRSRLRNVRFQTRARKTVTLVRLDLEGPDHTSPDGERVPTPHLHLYSEVHGSKFVIPVPAAAFTALDDMWTTLNDFMRYCNITRPPVFRDPSFQRKFF
ncbi:MAG: hypothetical protein OXI30_17840 [Chloroflexota bacterium]|nr:hypothetical protein [Chloroflexota bacterium]